MLYINAQLKDLDSQRGIIQPLFWHEFQVCKVLSTLSLIFLDLAICFQDANITDVQEFWLLYQKNKLFGMELAF